MSANIETAMYVREPAWHNEGVVLENAPDTDEALEKSGLDWGVDLRPTYIRGAQGYIETQMKAIVRDIDEKPLGFASERYNLFQNRDAFEWTRPLAESEYWDYEAAGSLQGGRRCWTLLKQGEHEVIEGDILKDYLLLTWAHDGKSAVIAQPTSIRVVCQNTLQASLRNGEQQKVCHMHGMVPKLEEIRKLYDIASHKFQRQVDIFRQLLDRPVKYQEREGYIRELIPIADNITERQKNGLGRIRSFLGQMAQGLVDGSSMADMPAGIRDTAYGVFMAMTEANEHYLGGKRVKDRGMNVLFGGAKEKNEKAYDLMQEFLQKPVGQAFAA